MNIYFVSASALLGTDLRKAAVEAVRLADQSGHTVVLEGVAVPPGGNASVLAESLIALKPGGYRAHASPGDPVAWNGLVIGNAFTAIRVEHVAAASDKDKSPAQNAHAATLLAKLSGIPVVIDGIPVLPGRVAIELGRVLSDTSVDLIAEITGNISLAEPGNEGIAWNRKVEPVLAYWNLLRTRDIPQEALLTAYTAVAGSAADQITKTVWSGCAISPAIAKDLIAALRELGP